MKYRYEIWCKDCRDSDSMGCFGGGTELSEETFETADEALKAMDEHISDGCTQWTGGLVTEGGNSCSVKKLLRIGSGIIGRLMSNKRDMFVSAKKPRNWLTR
jgi:hypothetical protein